MRKERNEFVKKLHSFCLIGVIALGLTTIIATGGGDGGGVGGGENGGKITITGTLSDSVLASRADQDSSLLGAVGSDWSSATVIVINSSGTVLATTSAGSNGSYSVSIDPGFNYISRANIGNLVMKAFVESATSDQIVNINPQSSAVVKVLGVVVGNLNIGEEGEDFSSGLSNIDISSTMESITTSPTLSEITAAIADGIERDYDASSTIATLGSAGTAGDSIAILFCSNIIPADTSTTDVTGTWSGTVTLTTIDVGNGRSSPITLILTQSGSSVSGSIILDDDEDSVISAGVVSENTLIITEHCTQRESDDCHLYGWTWLFTVSGATMTLTNVSGLVCDGDGHGGHDSLDPITGGSGTLTQ